MDAFSTLSLRLTAARELGLTQTALFFFYQLGKKTGLWQRLTPPRAWTAYQGELHTREIIPASEVLRATDSPPPPTPSAAEEIIHGRVTLFGALTVPLTLTVP
ncbi:MAG TPA: hypothetical protein PK530_03900, partial [Anaerolineales bacterium]|nr:hypothetical protein [Anaerolineales bacterium]